MFHRFAHQANTHVKPGMTMNRWGFHFDRTQTWWENAGADWFKYMARGQYHLAAGRAGIRPAGFCWVMDRQIPFTYAKTLNLQFLQASISIVSMQTCC
jgi:hypothetical protein